MHGPGTLAAFDFDGTLCSRDCVVPFMREVAGTGRLIGRLLAAPHRLLPALGRRDRDELKALAAAAAFRRRSVDEVSAMAARFADTVVDGWLRPDVLDVLESYRAGGARVVIVSASFELYLVPIAERLGIDAALGTRLEARDGHYTGRLDGPNCRTAEKVRRLDQWLESEELERSAITLHAYGDSKGDLELLAAADGAWWAAGHTLAPWSSP